MRTKTIMFKLHGNMCFLEALKKNHVTTFFDPATDLYIALFDEDQTDLYECAKKIMAQRVVVSLQKHA